MNRPELILGTYNEAIFRWYVTYIELSRRRASEVQHMSHATCAELVSQPYFCPKIV